MAAPPRRRALRYLCAIAAATVAVGLCITAPFLSTGALARTSTPANTSAHPGSAVPFGGISVADLRPNAQLSQADQSIAQAQALHARIVRTEIPWTVLEPHGPGQIDPRALAFVDRLVSDAAAAHIGVVMTVDGTPCWASSAPASLLSSCVPGRSDAAASAWPPREPATYAAFVGYLARRYGSQLAAIEVWNEPDQANQLYFAGPEKPQRYAAILRAAYPAVKQADPNLPVLAGSLVGSNGVFLRALYAAGIKGYYDGLSVHFYNLVLGSLRAIHQTQLANGDTKPLWLDEFGWSSCWPQAHTQQEQGCVTASTQATNLANTFRSLARTPYIAAEIVYRLQDTADEDFGVLTAGGARKPSFAMLASVLASPFGAPSRVTLNLRVHGTHVVASGSGPAGDYMGLEAFKGHTLRYKALFVLNRFNRYAITLPRVLGKHGLRVRVFQYWTGVAKGAQRSI